jgi:hypothetical protein
MADKITKLAGTAWWQLRCLGSSAVHISVPLNAFYNLGYFTQWYAVW